MLGLGAHSLGERDPSRPSPPVTRLTAKVSSSMVAATYSNF